MEYGNYRLKRKNTEIEDHCNSYTEKHSYTEKQSAKLNYFLAFLAKRQDIPRRREGNARSILPGIGQIFSI